MTRFREPVETGDVSKGLELWEAFSKGACVMWSEHSVMVGLLGHRERKRRCRMGHKES